MKVVITLFILVSVLINQATSCITICAGECVNIPGYGCVSMSGNYGSTCVIVDPCLDVEFQGKFKGDWKKVDKKPGIYDVRIAADSSTSTRIIVIYRQSLANIKARVKEDPNSQNFAKYGKLKKIRYNTSVSRDTLVFEYTSPSIPSITSGKGRELNIEFYYSNGGSVLRTLKVFIMRPPVLLVHGLWSNGDDAFGKFKQSPLISGKYEAFQIAFCNYDNDDDFDRNVTLLRWSKNRILSLCMDNGLIAGKVNLIGHSMGGIISRLYIQSTEYNNDVHKLITCNTPHAGSQAANILISNSLKIQAVRLALENVGKSVSNGAINDLCVNSWAIRDELNGFGRYADQTFKHAITTTALFSSPNPLFKNGYGYYLVRDIKYAFPELINGTNEDFLFYNEANDFIVPISSQIGGLPIENTSYYFGFWHSSTSENMVMQRLNDLLEADPNGVEFTQLPFDPPILPPPPGFKNGTRSSSLSIQITAPFDGTVYSRGDTIELSLSTSPEVKNILLCYGNEDVPLGAESFNIDSDFIGFVVPEIAVGILNFGVIGFDSLGNNELDTAFIEVNIPAQLDSILAESNVLEIPQNHENLFQIKGYYSDNVTRIITSNTAINYTFKTNKASKVKGGKIKGLQLGYDTLVLSYQGLYDTIFIEVVDSTEWLDIRNDVHVTGNIVSEPGTPVSKVTAELTGYLTKSYKTNNDGAFYHVVVKGNNYTITPSKNNDVTETNGITTLDIVLVRRHLLGSQLLGSPYKIIAADVNGSNAVTTLDIALIRKMILGSDSTFNGKLWSFVPSNFNFSNPLVPFPYDNFRSYTNISAEQTNQNFIGMKLGDVNNSWDPNTPKMGAVGDVRFMMDEQNVLPGDEIVVPVKVKDFKNIAGYQFTITWDEQVLELLEVTNKALTGYYGETQIQNGILTTSWSDDAGNSVTLNDNAIAFELKFKAIGNNGSASPIEINSALTQSEAYNGNLDLLNVVAANGAVKVGTSEVGILNTAENSYGLQIMPNPFANTTQIIFTIPQDETVNIIIYDLLGREVQQQKVNFTPGEHQIEWAGDDAAGKALGKGLYYIRMETRNYSRSAKAMLVR